ncbi:MAG: 8-oxoguanine deaminase [Calditrichaeota bacterium]|nr:8-oxoguanine deaminase [Calditrichota bacterium]
MPQSSNSSILIKNLAGAHVPGLNNGSISIRVKGNVISEIDGNLRIEPGDEVIDGSHLVAIPGLINTHHHFFQSLTRCLPGAQEAGLFDWLTFHYPIWKHFDDEMFRASYRVAMAELLLSGCTTSADHAYLFPGGAKQDLMALEVQCASEMGLRFSALRGSMTLGQSLGGLPPDDCIESDENVLTQCEETVRTFHDRSDFSMTQVHLAPCSPFNVSSELMIESAKLARELGVRLHTHLAETTDENEFCLSRYGKRPLALMQDWEWLGEDVWFAHGIYFNDAEIALLAATGTGLAHCPSSNCRLGSGKMKLRALLDAGVQVGLAVDGCASNDSSHMLAELRQTMLLHRTPKDREYFTARRVIDLATKDSALLLGRRDIGSLEVGKAADIVLFDLNELGYTGASDPVAALLFCAPTRPHTVMVNGTVVVRDRQLMMGDEEEIAKTGRVQAKRLLDKSR